MKGSSFLSHAASAIVITIFAALIYASVQQTYRSSANDPQLQIANDITNNLKKDRSIESLLPKDTIEISESLSPFVTLYNSNGSPIYSSGLLYGKMPEIPQGVFDFAKKNAENVLTWQPASGVRMAMVVELVHSKNIAFVAAGRSLQEVEKRESKLVKMVFIGWLLCLGVIGIHWIFGSFRK